MQRLLSLHIGMCITSMMVLFCVPVVGCHHIKPTYCGGTVSYKHSATHFVYTHSNSILYDLCTLFDALSFAIVISSIFLAGLRGRFIRMFSWWLHSCCDNHAIALVPVKQKIHLWLKSFANKKNKTAVYCIICILWVEFIGKLMNSPSRQVSDAESVSISCRQAWNVQWNLSVTTTSMIKFITCDLFSYVF